MSGNTNDRFVTSDGFNYLNTECGVNPVNGKTMRLRSFFPDPFGREIALALGRPLDLREVELLVGFDGEEIACCITGEKFRPVHFIRPYSVVEPFEDGVGVLLAAMFLDAIKRTGNIQKAIDELEAEGCDIHSGCFFQVPDTNPNDDKNFLAFSGSPVYVVPVQPGEVPWRVMVNLKSHLGEAIHNSSEALGGGAFRVMWGTSRLDIAKNRQTLAKRREEEEKARRARESRFAGVCAVLGLGRRPPKRTGKVRSPRNGH